MPRSLILAYLERALRNGFTGRIEIECVDGQTTRIRIVTEMSFNP